MFAFAAVRTFALLNFMLTGRAAHVALWINSCFAHNVFYYTHETQKVNT
jgi:hypothetical protein